MDTRTVVNRCPTGADRVIAETGQVAVHGQPVEVPAELAERLLAQSTVWAEPDTKPAPSAKKG